MTDEIVEDLDEVVEEAPVNDLCHEEVGYAQAAALNLGAHLNAREKLADADDQISKHAQTPAATKEETSQLGSTQLSDLCHEEYRSAAGLGFKISANRHAAHQTSMPTQMSVVIPMMPKDSASRHQLTDMQ